MPNIGPMEIAIVLIVALLILGPKKLPAAGRSLGEGLRGFKDSIAGKGSKDDEDDEDVVAVAAAEPLEERQKERVG